MDIREGRITFSFDENVIASKYDDWAFYRNQFTNVCGGAKAVDLICVDTEKTWLIEIKDYRNNARTKPIDLGEEVALKVRDTLAGLVAAKANANNQEEKRFARNALKNHVLRVVLHLEQPTQRSKLFPRAIEPSNVKIKLKQWLKAIDPHPMIVDQHCLIPSMSWKVEG